MLLNGQIFQDCVPFIRPAIYIIYTNDFKHDIIHITCHPFWASESLSFSSLSLRLRNDIIKLLNRG